MKKVLFFFFFIASFINNIKGQSPNWEWAKNIDCALLGSSADGIYSTKIDASGNVLAVGRFLSPSIIFDSYTLTNADNSGTTGDIFFLKYDSNGTVLWAESFGGPADEEPSNMEFDNSGNIYLTGSFKSDSISFGSTSLINSNNDSSADIFVLKSDASGAIVWAISEGGLNDDAGKSISLDSAANIYITGSFTTPTITFGATTLTNVSFAGGADVFVAKYDSSGNNVWAKSGEGFDNESPTSIATDVYGNVYVTGTFFVPGITFGPITLTDTAIYDIFIVKYDPSGNVMWARNTGGSNAENYSGNLVPDALGNMYWAGYFNGYTIDFNGSTLTNADTVAYSSDIFLLKLDSSGTVLWAKSMGGDKDEKAGLTLGANNHLFLSGFFSSSAIVFANDTLTAAIPGLEDGFLAEFDSTGSAVWGLKVGGASLDVCGSIAADNNGNIYVSGIFGPSSLAFGSDTLINPTNLDIFMAKLSAPYQVWPGDSDHNLIVNNNDLLPIGLYYSQTGTARDSISNLWQANSSQDWGINQLNGADIKHADCNGDGIIDNNDTLAISMNYSLVHAMAQSNVTLRASLPEIYFVTSASSYSPGQMVDAEVWIGTSTTPVSSLYGISFDISYDASLVQAGTEEISYPGGWLGSPGVNAIKISKNDPVANKVYGAIVRTNHINASGFGKIADFKFQVNSSITSSDSIQFSISNYMAVDAFGNNLVFDISPSNVLINVGIEENESTETFNIYPNPYSSFTQISYTLNSKSEVSAEVYDVIGNKVETLVKATQSAGEYKYNFSAKEKGLTAGVYFVKIAIDGKEAVKKIIEMK